MNLEVTFTVFVRDVLLRLLTLLALFLHLFQFLSFSAFLYTWPVFYGLIGIVLVTKIIQLEKPRINFNLLALGYTKIKELVQYGLFSIFSSLSSQVILITDQIMISSMLDLEKNGIYTLSFFIGSSIELPMKSLKMVSSPLLARYFKEKDHNAIKELYQKVSINQLIIGGWIFCGVVLNLQEIFAIIPKGNVLETGKIVVLFIGIGRLSGMIFGINDEILLLSDKYKVIIYLIPSYATLIVISNYILIPIMGIEGAALGSTISSTLYSFTKFVIVKLKFGYSPFTVKHLFPISIFVVIIFFGYNSPILFNAYLSILIKGTVFTLVYASLMLYFNVSADINSETKKMYKRLGL